MSLNSFKMLDKIGIFLTLLILSTFSFNSFKCEEENSETESNPIVEISNGKLEGKFTYSREGRKTAEFLGIKYGTVPKRFQKPEPNTEKWEGVKKAQNYGDTCKQIDFINVGLTGVKATGKEECLFLNVFSTNLNGDKKLPVLVFIHGGGFMLGGADWNDGHYLLDDDIVYVNFNYRLGIYGFLNANVSSAPGNAGMKDQVLALKWIQENIEKFGGDPEKVTILGLSAGASSVAYHLLSPMSKGLFRGAISQSGTATSPWALIKNPIERAKNLANLVDCPVENPDYMVECLAKIDPNILIEREHKFTSQKPTWLASLMEFTYVPTIEKVFDNKEEDAFLTDHPYTLLKNGKFNKVPWVLGATNNEGNLFGPKFIVKNSKDVNKHWGRFAPKALLFEFTAPDPAKISNEIREFYFGPNGISGEDDMQNVIDMISDRWFIYSSEESAKLYSKYAPAYLYMFDYKVLDSAVEVYFGGNITDELKRPSHGDDSFFQFKFPKELRKVISQDLRQTEERFVKISKSFNTLWASFVHTGKPTKLWNTTEIWTQVNPEDEEIKWWHIDETPGFIKEDEEFLKRMKFWANIDLNERENNEVFLK